LLVLRFNTFHTLVIATLRLLPGVLFFFWLCILANLAGLPYS
jgi:hypothetical protein